MSPSNSLTIYPGDEGLVVHSNGQITLLAADPDAPLSERHQALANAAHKIVRDTEFRVMNAASLRLLLAEPAGYA